MVAEGKAFPISQALTAIEDFQHGNQQKVPSSKPNPAGASVYLELTTGS
jgi:hypothetical protein